MKTTHCGSVVPRLFRPFKLVFHMELADLAQEGPLTRIIRWDVSWGWWTTVRQCQEEHATAWRKCHVDHTRWQQDDNDESEQVLGIFTVSPFTLCILPRYMSKKSGKQWKNVHLGTLIALHIHVNVANIILHVLLVCGIVRKIGPIHSTWHLHSTRKLASKAHITRDFHKWLQSRWKLWFADYTVSSDIPQYMFWNK